MIGLYPFTVIHSRYDLRLLCITFSGHPVIMYVTCYWDHSGYGLSQWETTLQCNVVSHWLSPYPEWSLLLYCLWCHNSCFIFQYVRWSARLGPHIRWVAPAKQSLSHYVVVLLQYGPLDWKYSPQTPHSLSERMSYGSSKCELRSILAIVALHAISCCSAIVQ